MKILVVCTLDPLKNSQQDSEGTKLEEATAILEHRTTLQTDLDRLEKWADRNLMRFVKDMSEVIQ